MRVKIRAIHECSDIIPFDYQYQLHSAIINIIRKSSPDYAEFLHKLGYEYKKAEKSYGEIREIRKNFKLYTFSNLKLFPKIIVKNGFKNVREVEFIFSTAVDKSFEHMILGVFSDNEFFLQFNKNIKHIFKIKNVETLHEPIFQNNHKFICLSPILMTTEKEEKHHCLDYMIPEEREKFISNIKQNLIRNYETFYKKDFTGSPEFEFSFDPVYIARKNGKISKLKKIVKDENVLRYKGFEAPFTIKADPELIKIGYSAGFGVNNAMGWGCVEILK